MNLIDIGRVVGARRAELGLTQAQLARLSGLSRQTLVGLENGTLSDLGVNRVGQVLAVLGLDSTQPDTQSRRKSVACGWRPRRPVSVTRVSWLRRRWNRPGQRRGAACICPAPDPFAG